MHVDIIIPAYNPGSYLIEALDSCMNQSYNDFTVTVVDDCSTQDVRSMLRRYPIVQYLKTSKNVGPAGARNLGIQNTDGELISFLDSDDIMHQDKLWHSVEAFKRNPKAGLVCGNYCFILNGKICRPFYKKNPPVNWHSLMRINYVASGSTTVKRDILDKIAGPPGFDERYWIGEDADFWLRISEKYPIEFIHKVLYYYRKQTNGNSLTDRADIQEKHLFNIEQMRKESMARMNTGLPSQTISVKT